MRLTLRPTRRILLALISLVPGFLWLPGCTDTPVRPTQVFDAPKAICPAPVALKSPNGLAMPASYGAVSVTGGTPPTTVSCSPASGSTFPIGTTPVTCTATDSVGRAGSCTFGITLTAPPRLSVTRFVAFGDSMTWGEDGSNALSRVGRTLSFVRPQVQLAAPDTYPGALQDKLTELYTAQSPIVTNAGKQGELVTDPLTFARFVAVTSGSYDVVLLMEGANDLPDHSFQEIIVGLNRMIDYARTRNMKVLLATLPPQNPNGFDPLDRGLQAAKVPLFNSEIASQAALKGVTLVDVFQAFGGDLTLIGDDGLHPTPAGYHLIAATFLTRIRQTLELPQQGTISNPSRAVPQFVLPRRR